MTQYSLFGAAATGPAIADLDGLLLAGGHWSRSASAPGAARLSIVVADRWRAEALAAAFAQLQVADARSAAAGAPIAPAPTARASTADPDGVTAAGGYAARTAFSPLLAERAALWTRGARTGLPPAFELTPGGLRLWAIASGRRDDVGYLLGTAVASHAQPDDTVHRAAGAQLSRLGVTALSLARRGTGWGTGWRITSARRLRRLTELLGPPPPGAACDWPEAAATPHR